MSRHFDDEVPLNLQYMRDVFGGEDELLRKIARHLIEHDMAIQIGPEEGRILQLLIAMNQVRTVVELGTLGGYSAIWMARALPEGGMVYTIEKEEANAALAQTHFDASDVADKITLLQGEGQKILPKLASKAPFDMIFIDADKPGYTAYLDWAEQNIREGGLIVGDNTLLFDAVAEPSPPSGVSRSAWEAMREFNKRLSDTSRYDSAMIPTKEGMTVARKRY